MRKHKTDFIEVAAQTETEATELAAILFPELIRYSVYKDFFETQALELLYIDYGKKTADFSIGRFQMKPSFAEAVEAYILAHEQLQLRLI